MSFINAVVISISIVCISVAFIILICVFDCFIDPYYAAQLIITFDMFMNKLYECADSTINVICCCCISDNRTIIPGPVLGTVPNAVTGPVTGPVTNRPPPIREIELTQIVIVENPEGIISVGRPCNVE